MPEPIDTNALKSKEWRHSEATRCRYRVLNDGPNVHIGVAIQSLDPGCNTRPAHYHMEEEEHVFVLNGELAVRLGDREFRLTAGHYICFAAGDPREHCLYNRSDAPCEYLLWGDRSSADVIVYPDSKKVSVRSLDEIYRRDPLDYWDSEE